MGHKHHRKKKYYSVTDRPIFKILSAMLMIALFAFLYYFVVLKVKQPGLALSCIVPCVLLMIWVAVKQRYFWWIWLVGACPCVFLMIMFRLSGFVTILENAYWVMSFAMCMWLVLCPSRARSRANKRKKTRQQQYHHSDEPVAPRPRDELLEKLFGDME